MCGEVILPTCLVIVQIVRSRALLRGGDLEEKGAGDVNVVRPPSGWRHGPSGDGSGSRAKQLDWGSTCQL